MQKKHKIIIISIILILGILTILKIFVFKDYKMKNLGNNNSIFTTSESKIFNMKSYEAEITVTVKSNKNTNTYVLSQKYVAPNLYKQEIIEPFNIKGLTISYDGKDLKLHNTKLNINKVYENYMYIGDNFLLLNQFIKEYTESSQSKKEENETEEIYKTIAVNSNKYAIYKTLYIDKKTKNPTKLEIQDINQNTMVYILYNKIKIDSLNENDIFI